MKLMHNIDIKTLKMAGVYKIVNHFDGKVYYGSAANTFQKRLKDHRNMLNNGTHDNTHLQRAYHKYGVSNFEFMIAEIVCRPNECTDEEFDLIVLAHEQKYLDEHWDNCRRCYNICRIANNCSGRKDSEETRKRKSESRKGNKNPFYGKTYTNEARALISASKVGKKLSPEACRNISEGHKGLKRTPEQRANMIGLHAGEKAHFAKLTWNEVGEIRAKFLSGTHTLKKLGEEYNVHRATIGYIVNNKTWIRI